jgi:hypothetical protein
MLVLCVLCAPVVLLGLSAEVHQKISKPRHIRDRRKALDETNQTITFNWGGSGGSDKILMNLGYLWRYLA